MVTETFINGKWTRVSEENVHEIHERIFVPNTSVLTGKTQVDELTALGLSKFYNEN